MPAFFETVRSIMGSIDWQDPIFIVASFLLGAAIGSFLNVAIYRLPRGLSVNKPSRSFCPVCNKDIPWYRNIPLFTWLVQRGKCAACQCKIPFRYFAVELLTAIAFVVMWVSFSDQPDYPGVALFYMLLMAMLIVIVFIDAELMLIPLQVTWMGTAMGLIAALFFQDHLQVFGWKEGLVASLVGCAAGFGALWSVVLLGKFLFGKKKMEYAGEVDWMLREPEELAEELADGHEFEQELCFVIDGEEHGWSDLFYRASDKLIIQGRQFRIDEKLHEGSEITILGETIQLNGETYGIEKLESLSGKATKVTIPREAMGMGDVYLMGMLGACLGWQSVLFTIFTACLFSLFLAIIGRLGIGSRLPFGPSLAFGGVCWIFWGWEFWAWYFGLMGTSL